MGWQGGIDTSISRSYEDRRSKPLCEWKAADESRTPQPLRTKRGTKGNTHADIHENPFLYSRAPVARAWIGVVNLPFEAANVFFSSIDAYGIGVSGIGVSQKVVWISSSPQWNTDTRICGALLLSAGLHSRYHTEEECELVAISTCRWKLFFDRVNGPLLRSDTEADFKRAQMQEVISGEDSRAHYVLWIGRENGVAYRRGLGVVLVNAWKSLDPKIEEIVLR